MALDEGQVQVRDLIMGPGTDFTVMDGFNPFNRQTRADQSGPRAWNHGSWSGVEWAAETVVSIPIRVRNQDDGTPSGWLSAHQQLAAAFAPVGESASDVELRFNYCGDEYLMFGRPRMVEPAVETARRGYSLTRCAFVALDPLIYSGDQVVVSTGLPTFSGGMTFPFTFPFTFDGVLADGRETLTNSGTADVGLLLRIDGPVQRPWVALQRPDGVVQRLTFDLNLNTGQWLIVDTAARTVFLNGLASSSQRGRVSGDFPILPSGESTIRFDHGGEHNETAELTVTYRHAWW